MKTHWKKKFNYDYLGSYSLPENEDVIVTIEKLKTEQVTNISGKKEECLVVYFKEANKPMILNRTNSKAIEHVVGSPYIEDWPGNKIQIYVQQGVKAFGTVTDALRVRDFKPKVKMDVSKYKDVIMICDSLEKLKIAYMGLPKEVQADDEIINLKNELKIKLSEEGNK